jgi:hypothetical protein
MGKFANVYPRLHSARQITPTQPSDVVQRKAAICKFLHSISKITAEIGAPSFATQSVVWFAPSERPALPLGVAAGYSPRTAAPPPNGLSPGHPEHRDGPLYLPVPLACHPERSASREAEGPLYLPFPLFSPTVILSEAIALP